jgi:hypothetical protein
MGCCQSARPRRSEAVPTFIQSGSLQVPEIPRANLDFVDSLDVDTLETSPFVTDPINPDDNAIPIVTGPPDEELIARMLIEAEQLSD